MDRLLGEIEALHEDDALLPNVVAELERVFGDELHIRSGHLYEEIGKRFSLKYKTTEQPIFRKSFPSDSDEITDIVENQGRILEGDYSSEFLVPDNAPCGGVPVALMVSRGPMHRWLIVYCLTPGWNYEEIAFCLNGVRASLNYRMRAVAAESDLDQAADIQRSLLPSRPPRFANYDIAASSRSAETVGGDFFDFLDLSNQILGLVIGDASGHGLPAALLVRDVMMGIRMGTSLQLKMIYSLKKLNSVIHNTTYSTRFTSLFYGELEKNGNVLYANMGHTPGLIIDGDNVTMLSPTGTIMGPLADLQLDRAYAYLPVGGILVLYTDGITERVRSNGEAWDIDGLVALIKENRDLPAKELLEVIFKTALSLGHESDILEDDATVVVVKRPA